MHIEIPEKLIIEKDEFPFISLSSYKQRMAWNDRGMWAFVSWNWVLPFVTWINNRKVLEIMSGAGWLAKALRQKNVNIIATDDYSFGGFEYKMVAEVEKLEASVAVKKYGSDCDILIVSWPYMDDTAFKAIRALHRENPKIFIVYIGEGEGGCTASDKFFNHFSEIDNDEVFNAASNKFQAWPGLHDRLLLGSYFPLGHSRENHSNKYNLLG